MVRVHDAVVVGAGPGGAATAHFLSAQGADVLLLDRAEFPRDKTCGDGLTPRAVRMLEAIGVLDDVAAQACRVDAYQVVAPNGRVTTAPLGDAHQALVTPRLRLDHLLLRRAIQTGSRFEPDVRVIHLEPNARTVRVHADTHRTFDARVAVIATGAATDVLRRSGILARQPRTMLAARAYVDDLPHDLPQHFQFRFDAATLPGYGWVFPLDRRSANIGVCFLPGRPATQTAARAFQRFINGPRMRRLLRGSRQVGPLRGYPIRMDFPSAPTSAERTLLVGEAAGLVNPLTGEGIDYALESGRIAADHVVQALRSGVHDTWGTEYDRLLRARFERLFRFSAWMRDWYCRPPLLNVLVALANRYPELRQLLASMLLGQREPHGYGPAESAARLIWYLARRPRRKCSQHD